ncbi:MAG TPA: hypothetical protein PLZ57_00770 [Pseudobdellovibrionaceae bacterium]|nr:hypothetical protein [Pseudobdellovibrionaceae bacterium]
MPLNADDSYESSPESTKIFASSLEPVHERSSSGLPRARAFQFLSAKAQGIRSAIQSLQSVQALKSIRQVRIQDVRREPSSRFATHPTFTIFASSGVKSALILTGFLAYAGGPQILGDGFEVEEVYQAVMPTARQTDRVISEGIVLKLDREAPPVVALEEALREDPWTQIDSPVGFEVPSTALRVSSTRNAPAHVVGGVRLSSEELGLRIAREIQRDNERLAAHRQTLERREAAAVDSRNFPSAAPALPKVSIVPQAVNSVPAEAKPATKVVDSPSAIAPSIVISASQVGLSRDQILAAFLSPILQSESAAANRREVAAARAQASKVESARPATTDPRVTAILENARAARRPQETESITTATGVANPSVAPVHRQVMVSGSLEFAEGLALTHPADSLVVLREDRGRLHEAGVVWVKEARYEIFLESLQGHLVAELRTPQGTVVGRGRVNLSSVVSRLEELHRDRAENKRVDGVSLRLAPTAPGVFGHTQSAYTVGAHQQPLKSGRVVAQGTNLGTRTQANGQFRDPRFADGSRPLLEARAQEHLPTQALASVGTNTQLTLIPQKMAATIRELVADQVTPQDTTPQAMAEMGMIWGRVLRRGEGVAGARVEPMSSGVSAVVYFNDLLIPDPSLEQTSANGWFVIPYARQGGHVLHVNLGTRWSDPMVVGVSPGSVAQVEAEITRGSEVFVRGLDAFRPDWPLHVEVRPMLHRRGRRVAVDRTQESTLRVAHANQDIALDLDAGPEYIRTRMILDPERRDLNMPMLPRGWLEKIRSQVKHNGAPAEGVVVGFFQGQRFQLKVSEAWRTENTRVVYFDSRGEVTAAPYGEPGGGFVIFGVQEGVHNIVVGLEGSDRVFATTAWVESSTPMVINHWLR